ncbi:MAG: 4-coumarate--CoA ligase family protein [Acidimicrobiia bacterium]|nr:4-coumarate--CoA ligase family protein [Acidimicrobiia bacterium]
MAVFPSLLPEVELPESHITPFVFRYAEELADKPALIDGPTGRTLTYGQLYGATMKAAGGLAARGFGKGEVLAIMAPNIPEYAIAFHAVAALGGVVTTINPTYTAEEVEFQLNDAGARYLLTIPMFMDVATEAAGASGTEEVFVFGEAEGATPFASLLDADPIAGFAEVDPREDTVVLPYSSGTTGLPKGVMLTHHNLTSNLAQAKHVLDITDDEVIIAVLPFFHIYGMQILMNGVLYNGATAVTMPRFDLEQFLGLLQEHKVTKAYLVPPIILALAKHPLVDQYDLSALRQIFSGAAPLGADVEAEAGARVGAEVVQGYGLTETSPVTHATPPGKGRSGSIGVTISNTDVRIIDPETGDDLGVGENGEVLIKGPQVMKGYLNNPDATAECIDDEGWFHTGDVGYVDDDGYFYIVDRIKELIKYKGFQVPPAELEALLLTHAAVADAAVIPVPDLEAGEIPKAFVVLRPGAEATGQQLMDHVAEHVAHYKQVRRVEFLDEIPKSLSGKILRRVLRDREREATGT